MQTRRPIIQLSTALAALVSPAAVMAQSDHPVPSRVTTVSPRWLNDPTESRDGRFIATTSDSAIYLFDRNAKRWQRLTDAAAGPRWSPDGRFLAFARREQAGFMVWLLPFNPATGKASGPERRVSVRGGRGFGWSPDGKEIAILSVDSGWTKLWIQPFNGGDEREVARIRGSSPMGGMPAWSPDGKAIYFAGGAGPGYIARVTLASRKVDSLRPMRDLIGISADGRFIAQANRFADVIVISSASDGREVKRVYLPHSTAGKAWSSRVPGEIVGLEHPVYQELHSVSLADGSTRRLVSGDSIQAGGPQLSPDGSQMLFTNGSRLVVSRPDGSGARVMKTTVGVRPRSAAWSSDGSHIAYMSVEPKELHVVDARTGADTRVIRIEEKFPLAARRVDYIWRADGRALRYSKLDLGNRGMSYDVHEVTLAGRDSVIASVPDSLPGFFHFINDTLLLRSTNEGQYALNPSTNRWTTLIRGNAEDLSLSSDGRRMAYGFWPNPNTDDAVLKVAEGSDVKTIANPFGGEVQYPYFLPDGKNLIVAICATCATAERRQLVLFPINGDPPRVLSGKPGTIMDWDVVQVTRDGRTLIYDPELAWRTAVVHIPIDLEPRP